MRSLLILIVAGAAASSQAQIVNMDARTDCFGVQGAATVALDAGSYILRPVGPPEGAFTAWNAWGGAVSGCGAGGSGCGQGWLRSYFIDTGSGPLRTGGDVGIWSTAEAALAAAGPMQLRLCAAATVRFSAPDNACGDNIGGVSLRIEPDPCPVDVDLDGTLNIFDFLRFQDLFTAGDLRADFDCSGELDIFDFLAFQDLFTAGC